MNGIIAGLISFLGHPKAQAELKTALSSGMESIFAERAIESINKRVDKRALEAALIAGNISLFALSPENPEELSPLRKTAATMALRASVFNAYKLASEALEQDLALENKFSSEKGEYYGITDPNLIMQNVIAFHAEKSIKRSRLYEETCYAFNEQKGGAGVSMEIDFTSGKHRALPGTQPLKVNDSITIRIDVTRDKLAVEGVPGMDKGEIAIIANDVRNGYATDVTTPSSKNLRSLRWPASRFGEWSAKGKILPSESLTKSDILSEANMINPVDLTKLPADSDVRNYAVCYYGVDPNALFAPNRRMLHERITEMLNNPINKNTYINPAFMQIMTKGDDGQIRTAMPQVGSVYGDASEHIKMIIGEAAINALFEADRAKFNEQHAVGVERTIDISAEPPKELGPVKPDAPATSGEVLPITREMCGNGNKYSCLVCGKKGLKKNNLSQFKPAKLPEGMTSDFPGVADSVKYENSWMCGTCADSLRKQREAAVKAFSANKSEIAKATAEEEALLAEGLKAEAEVTAHKDALEECTIAIENLKDKGVPVPNFMLEQKDKLAFNLQEAETKFQTIDTKLLGAGVKVDAMKSGAARVAPAATPTQAKVISTPPPSGKNRKDRRNRGRA